jgi:hypothetical protein
VDPAPLWLVSQVAAIVVPSSAKVPREAGSARRARRTTDVVNWARVAAEISCPAALSRAEEALSRK